MQTFKHLLNTWLLAYLSFPFFYTGYFLLLHNEAEMQQVPLLYLFGFVFSLPAFMTCFAGLRYLANSNLGYEMRYLLWLLIVSGSIICTTAALSLLLSDFHFLMEILPFIAAAVVAAISSVLMRFNQFIYLMQIKSQEHENNMV